MDQPVGKNNKAQACGVICDGSTIVKALYNSFLWMAFRMDIVSTNHQ